MLHITCLGSLGNGMFIESLGLIQLVSVTRDTSCLKLCGRRKTRVKTLTTHFTTARYVARYYSEFFLLVVEEFLKLTHRINSDRLHKTSSMS